MRSWIFKGLFLLLLCAAVFGSAGWFGYQLLVKPYQLPPEEQAGGKPSPPPDPSLPDFEKAMKVRDARQPVATREAMERFIETYPFSTKLAEARKALGEANTDIFFSAIPAPSKVRYEIHSGDNLDKIKRKFKTSDEIIMRCNNLEDPRRLRIGQVLWVSQPDFTVIIDRKAHTVLLLDKGKFFKEYKAASWNIPVPKRGAANTPIEAKVSKKLAWANGSPVAFPAKEYAGSARWVELNARGYALYTEGAQKPSSGIGMQPEDMEEISTLLTKGVPVTIR
ncbi:MAG: LysM peptidoglycan-binding domain-containing protein [Chthoniobacteraceae bacterium]|nr:LysM peptidoglycan-binding domain-containing protein [Chthoniobacteraceae bacterium]